MNENIDVKPIIGKMLLFIVIFSIISRLFGLTGVLVALTVLFINRLIKIFTKKGNTFVEILKWFGSIVYIGIIIFSAINRDWLGVIGLITISFLLLSYRLYYLFKSWGLIKGMALQQWKLFERNQLGRDLDDPYWDTHKKPTYRELFTGKYVPKDKKGNIIKNE